MSAPAKMLRTRKAGPSARPTAPAPRLQRAPGHNARSFCNRPCDACEAEMILRARRRAAEALALDFGPRGSRQYMNALDALL